MITAIDHHVDALTAMLYPAHTKRCEMCGGYVVTTPYETLKRSAEAASEPLAKFAQELEDDFAARFEKLVSQSVVDRVDRYRDLVAQIATGDVGAVMRSARDATWSERQAQLDREFAALGLRYYESSLDLQSQYAHRLLQQLAADVEAGPDQPPAGEPPPETPPATRRSSAAQRSPAVKKSPRQTKKPPKAQG